MKNTGTGTRCPNADIGAGVPGSQDFFDRLENLIGSVHTTEPDLRIVVYDMGLTRAQRRQVPASTLCLLSVAVRVCESVLTERSICRSHMHMHVHMHMHMHMHMQGTCLGLGGAGAV